MKLDQIQNSIQAISLAKNSVETAEQTAGQVASRVEETAEGANRTLAILIDQAESSIAGADADQVRTLRRFIDEMYELKASVSRLLQEDFRGIKGKLVCLGQELEDASQAIARIEPQE